MPKGSNPNSRANLAKGKATRFRKGDTQGKREAAIASNKAQAQKRSMREWAEYIGNLKANPEIVEKIKEHFVLTPEEEANITNNGLSILKLQEQVQKGNLNAFNLWLDLTGQKAAQKHEVITHQEIDISKVKNLKKLLDD
jgi:hypothetical protein